jgi:GT2 family glycosyltransferase
VTLSVLICTYNRPALLVKALRGLLVDASEMPDEVVVVNGGGEMVDRAMEPFLTAPYHLRVLHTRNVSLAASQNIGLPECGGDLVALTDDDAIVAPDWVQAIRMVMKEHPEAGAVGGAVITLFPEARVARLAHYTTFPEPSVGSYVRTVAGVNVCYRREVIQKVGAIDEGLVSGEEVDYNWRVIRAGWKIWWDPRIRVFHHDRREFRAYLLQQFTYGRGYWQTRRRHSDLYGQYPRSLRTVKDWAKLAYFLPGAALEPLRVGRTAHRWDDRWTFPFLLSLAACAHRLGYVAQAWRERGRGVGAPGETSQHPVSRAV